MTSGIFGCDKCKEEYIFDGSNRCVFDESCRVSGCQKCSIDVKICEECFTGLWYSQEENTCVDGTCKVSDCKECSTSGPDKCDSCVLGMFLQDETTCALCEDDFCDRCSDATTCTQC